MHSYISDGFILKINRRIFDQAHVYYKSSDDCAAFLANYGSSSDATVDFRGKSYFLPAWSVSILPDCVNVVFNTAKVYTVAPLSTSSSEVSQLHIFHCLFMFLFRYDFGSRD